MPDLEKEAKFQKGKLNLKLAAKWSPLLKVGMTFFAFTMSFSLGAIFEQNYNITNRVTNTQEVIRQVTVEKPPVYITPDRVVDGKPVGAQKVEVVLYTEEGETHIGLFLEMPEPIIKVTPPATPEFEVPEPTLEIPTIPIVKASNPPTTGWQVDRRRPLHSPVKG